MQLTALAAQAIKYQIDGRKMELEYVKKELVQCEAHVKQSRENLERCRSQISIHEQTIVDLTALVEGATV